MSAFQDGLFLLCPHEEAGAGRRALSSTTSTSAANLASKLDMWLSRVHILFLFSCLVFVMCSCDFVKQTTNRTTWQPFFDPAMVNGYEVLNRLHFTTTTSAGTERRHQNGK